MAEKRWKFVLVSNNANLHSITQIAVTMSQKSVKNGLFWVKKELAFVNKKVHMSKKYDFLKPTHRGYLKMPYEKN